MDKQSMNLMQIRAAGLAALMRELGPTGMVRFLQQYETGSGDYSRERHEWLGRLDGETIAKQIFERRKKKRGEVNNPEHWLKGKCNRYPRTAVLVEKQDSIQ